MSGCSLVDWRTLVPVNWMLRLEISTTARSLLAPNDPSDLASPFNRALVVPDKVAMDMVAKNLKVSGTRSMASIDASSSVRHYHGLVPMIHIDIVSPMNELVVPNPFSIPWRPRYDRPISWMAPVPIGFGLHWAQNIASTPSRIARGGQAGDRPSGWGCVIRNVSGQVSE